MKTEPAKAQVIIPNLKQFGQFPTVEVVNGNEPSYMQYNHYLICVDYFSVYLVVQDNEQDALDELADYFEEQGREGHFLNEAGINENEEVIRAGKHGRALACDQLIIEQI